MVNYKLFSLFIFNKNYLPSAASLNTPWVQWHNLICSRINMTKLLWMEIITVCSRLSLSYFNSETGTYSPVKHYKCSHDGKEGQTTEPKREREGEVRTRRQCRPASVWYQSIARTGLKHSVCEYSRDTMTSLRLRSAARSRTHLKRARMSSDVERRQKGRGERKGRTFR